MASLADFHVTQIAQIAQFFCIASLAGGDAVFLFRLALRAEIYKSGRLFPCGDFFPGAGT